MRWFFVKILVLLVIRSFLLKKPKKIVVASQYRLVQYFSIKCASFLAIILVVLARATCFAKQPQKNTSRAGSNCKFEPFCLLVFDQAKPHKTTKIPHKYLYFKEIIL
jgi:hypothetical protein